MRTRSVLKMWLGVVDDDEGFRATPGVQGTGSLNDPFVLTRVFEDNAIGASVGTSYVTMTPRAHA